MAKTGGPPQSPSGGIFSDLAGKRRAQHGTPEKEPPTVKKRIAFTPAATPAAEPEKKPAFSFSKLGQRRRQSMVAQGLAPAGVSTEAFLSGARGTPAWAAVDDAPDGDPPPAAAVRDAVAATRARSGDAPASPAAPDAAEAADKGRAVPEHKVRALQRRRRTEALRVLARVVGAAASRRAARLAERGLRAFLVAAARAKKAASTSAHKLELAALNAELEDLRAAAAGDKTAAARDETAAALEAALADERAAHAATRAELEAALEARGAVATAAAATATSPAASPAKAAPGDLAAALAARADLEAEVAALRRERDVLVGDFAAETRRSADLLGAAVGERDALARTNDALRRGAAPETPEAASPQKPASRRRAAPAPETPAAASPEKPPGKPASPGGELARLLDEERARDASGEAPAPAEPPVACALTDERRRAVRELRETLASARADMERQHGAAQAALLRSAEAGARDAAVRAMREAKQATDEEQLAISIAEELCRVRREQAALKKLKRQQADAWYAHRPPREPPRRAPAPPPDGGAPPGVRGLLGPAGGPPPSPAKSPKRGRKKSKPPREKKRRVFGGRVAANARVAPLAAAKARPASAQRPRTPDAAKAARPKSAPSAGRSPALPRWRGAV